MGIMGVTGFTIVDGRIATADVIRMRGAGDRRLRR
jgi:hypothetical protein